MQHPRSSAVSAAVRAASLRLLACWAGVISVACSDQTVPLAPDASPAELAAARTRSRIAFSALAGDNPEIFAVTASGGNAVRLTFFEGFSYDPAVSPDGRLIAFASYASGFPEIYTMRRNGRGLKQLTTFEIDHVGSPAWSPDGTRIAFERMVGANTDIYVMQKDGTGVTRLTESAGVDRQPAWSPDGTTIAFASNRDGSFQVYTMAADGSSEVPFTVCGAANCFSPAWSPDGERIAFQRGNDLHLQNVTGGTPVTIATGLTERATPTWSPDGTELAFVAVDGQPDIFAIHPDGSGRRRITNTPVEERGPSWGK